jgi:hypothetical protein
VTNPCDPTIMPYDPVPGLALAIYLVLVRPLLTALAILLVVATGIAIILFMQGLLRLLALTLIPFPHIDL